VNTEALEALLIVRREYIDAGYEAACNEYGSIDAWLRDGLGITDAERKEWQQAMLVRSDRADDQRPAPRR
jgi:protein-tyrosine phosphatase